MPVHTAPPGMAGQSPTIFGVMPAFIAKVSEPYSKSKIYFRMQNETSKGKVDADIRIHLSN